MLNNNQMYYVHNELLLNVLKHQLEDYQVIIALISNKDLLKQRLTFLYPNDLNFQFRKFLFSFFLNNQMQMVDVLLAFLPILVLENHFLFYFFIFLPFFVSFYLQALVVFYQSILLVEALGFQLFQHKEFLVVVVVLFQIK